VPLGPDILLVGLGSPKQEQLIRALRPLLPRTWMIGVGVSFSFLAGEIRRAPLWLQALGLEWVHRLLQEPRRLAKRYLVEDLPFAFRLFASALATRMRNLLHPRKV
jgi:N-acetylglucosaminyldiphosphoundecaprenol N-acetyl-beta-D-mannosaminyltransferase